MTLLAPTSTPTADPSIIAALDLGTNSFHLVVARHTADGFEVVTREKEMIRLGHGGSDMKELSADAIDRGVEALQRMRQIAHSHGAASMRAVATSATREARNAEVFIDRARTEAGVEIEVISGLEEARLIHLGILQTMPIFERRVLCIDIGGGSTELVIGQRTEMLAARSFKLGAVRLTDRFFPDGDIPKGAIDECRSHIRSVLTHFDRAIETFGFEICVASSGTAEAIARLARRLHHETDPKTYNCFAFSRTDLAVVTEQLCSQRTARRRSRLAGLESNRADIAVAGALIMDEIVERFGVEEITFSEGALRDGVLLDTFERRSAAGRVDVRNVTQRSIRALQERCDDDPAHSEQVAQLALQLFDGLAPWHGLDTGAREYLSAAARLANVGLMISYSRHHVHSYYIIRNSELVGLTDHEIELIALIARYHRKSTPKVSHPDFGGLRRSDQELVRSLAAILRVAIGLDRSHEARVASVTASVDDDRIVITALPAGDADINLELYAARERSGLLAELSGRAVEIS